MSNEQPKEKTQSFWSTLPGILTAISGLIVAITGLVTVLGRDGESAANATPTKTEIATQETIQASETTAPEPTHTQAQPTDTAEVTQPTMTITMTITPTTKPELEHIVIPEEPDNFTWFTEPSSLVYASQGRSTADDFINLNLERPFTAQSMNYVGYVDINRVEITSAKSFIYISIGVEETPPQDEEVYYGVEIDLDMDGRGDYLIYGLVPSGTEWTVDGVRVYQDSDDNVGGPSPITSNNGISGNGYEVTLFDSGYGSDDPDLAWIRRSPSKGNHIQIAFKLSLIDNTKRFLWSGWADAGPMQPANFDYNDYYTLQDAGSPILDTSDYPLKELALVDNTCRFAYGFNPKGDEPGLCP